ncbi:hypothetical protein BJY00DRAFT_154655 [Aspergillus carlsbadensis]|nr:hypothetical protein BJY00DRAFT_154655 [Aspergillus carlsbadensis]
MDFQLNYSFVGKNQDYGLVWSRDAVSISPFRVWFPWGTDEVRYKGMFRTRTPRASGLYSPVNQRRGVGIPTPIHGLSFHKLCMFLHTEKPPSITWVAANPVPIPGLVPWTGAQGLSNRELAWVNQPILRHVAWHGSGNPHQLAVRTQLREAFLVSRAGQQPLSPTSCTRDRRDCSRNASLTVPLLVIRTK